MAAVESGPRTLISPAQLSRGRGKIIYWVVLVLLIPLFALVFLFPLYWMVTGGLKSPPRSSRPADAVPGPPAPHNYVTAWNDLGLGRLIFNTTSTRSARWCSRWCSTWPPRTRCPSCARCSAT